MISVFRFIFVLWVSCCGVSLAGSAQTFIAGTEDIPLMPGLVEVVGAGLVFDKPDGRIVEAYAEGRGLASVQVLGFYRQTLPQLGWKPISDLQYQREGEDLRLSISTESNRLVVRFDIAPR